MLSYRVTISIAHSHEADWYEWMESKHILDVLATGYFAEASIEKQLEPEPPQSYTTYHITYSFSSMHDLESYQQHAVPALQAEHTERYAGFFTASRCISERKGHFSSPASTYVA